MWKTIKSLVLPALIGFTLLALIGLGGSALLLFREAQAIHPWLGWGVAALLGLGVVLLVLVPAARMLMLPRGLRRPAEESGPSWEKYVRRYGKRLIGNRRLRDDYDGFENLQAAHAGGDPVLLQNEIEKATAFLSRVCQDIVSRHAAAVFAATAVSQSGRLDTAIVLSAQMRMVKEVAELYYQRPGFRELLRLYGNVGATAFLAGEIEDSEVLAVLSAPVTAGITGLIPVHGTDPIVSLLVNSLLDGSTNAFLTLRVGILAQRHCGLTLERERRSLARSAALEAGGLLADVVGRGAKRVAAATRRAVTRTAVSGPRRAAETAVRGTGRLADAVVSGTERATGSVVGLGTSFDRLTGRHRGPDQSEPDPLELATAETELEEAATFWDTAARLFRTEREEEPPSPRRFLGSGF